MQVGSSPGPAPDVQLKRQWSARGEAVADGVRRIEERREEAAGMERRAEAVKAATNDAIRAATYAASGRIALPGGAGAPIATA